MKCETMMQTKCKCKKNCSRTSASSNISLITERHTYFSGEKNQHFFFCDPVFYSGVRTAQCFNRISNRLCGQLLEFPQGKFETDKENNRTWCNNLTQWNRILTNTSPFITPAHFSLFNIWVQAANCWQLFLKRVHGDICPEFNSLQYVRFSRKMHPPAAHQRRCSAN